MKNYLLLTCLLCLSLATWAQMEDTVPALVVDIMQDQIVQYKDTFQACETSLADDAYLLDVLAQQSQARYDSIQHVLDSLHHEQELLMLAQQAYMDSLRQDSVNKLMAHLDTLREEQLALDEIRLELPKGMIKDPEEDRQDSLRLKRLERSNWRRELNLLSQISQNYVSDNWYAGGNSNFAIQNSVKGMLNYDARKRITWDNTLEWRMGASTVHGDSLRKMNITDDIFRYNTKLGIKFYEKLYVSVSGEFNATLFNTFVPNVGKQEKIKSGWMSPARINLGLGIDYKPIKGLSLLVSPLAYKMIHINDTVRMDYKSYGINEGKKTLNELGSSVRVEWQWKPLRELAINTIFYSYTNYKAIELDLEVTADFIINRFLSTRVTLHPRYDSTRIMGEDEKAKIQFKELISVGFAHKFK